MDELLIKYLVGEADREEEQAALDWISAGDEHLRYFNQLKRIWEKSKNLKPEVNVDEGEAWERFKTLINKTGKETATFSAKRRLWPIAATAAAVVILLGLAISGYFFDRNQEVTIASLDDVRTHTLPDGSIVTLNKNTTLTYGKRFNGKMRNVQLYGEGFFDVSSDPSKPFIIQVGEVTVKVVGTSFNVKQTDDNIEVIVETGEVNVAKKANAVRLLPQQKATVFAYLDQPLVEHNEDEFYSFYRTNKLVCNATPLWKLVETLNNIYHAEIVITDPEIRGLTITTTFKDNSLTEVINVLGQTLDIHVQEKGGQIYLSK